jgi:glycosyltransferase involved in cell wall biosynthesis
MKSQRISLIASHHLPVPPIRGGAIQLWINEVAKLVSRECEVQVISPWDPEIPLVEEDGNLIYQRIRFGRVYVRLFQKILGIDPLSYPQRAAKYVYSFQADRVHLFGGGSQWLPVMRRRFGSEKWIIIHLANDPGDELHKWKNRKFEKVGFIACSEYIRKKAIEHLGISSNLCHIIYNGANIKAFSLCWERAEERRRNRANYGIPSEAFVLLFCGRVAPEKGPQHLAAAAASIMARHKNIWVVFVGDFRKEPNERKIEWWRTYQEIQSNLKDHWNRVVFTGPVPPSKMPDMFAMGDVFVGPGEWDEPFGMVYVEAMATGLPVIATNSGGVPEIILDGETGYLIPKGDVNAIRQRLLMLIMNNEVRDRMGRAGRKRVEEKFAWEKIAAQFVKFDPNVFCGQ